MWTTTRNNPHRLQSRLLKKNNQMAIISLVSGILAWTILPVIGSLAAVICGHMARKQLATNPQETGGNLAVIGLILGYAQLVVFVLVLLVMIFGGIAIFSAQ